MDFVSQKGVVDTQLIAHDKEVYDIAWGGMGVFASVSADGSVRVFDLRWVAQSLLDFVGPVSGCISITALLTCLLCRDKEHSTIIYESPKPEVPLLRLGWNKQDPRYMATILMDSCKVVVLDIRCAFYIAGALHLYFVGLIMSKSYLNCCFISNFSISSILKAGSFSCQH